MTIDAPHSNYLSDADIMEWMEAKTEGMYGTMRSAMDTADQRTQLESELGDLKSKLAGLKNGSVSQQDAESAIAGMIDKYQAFPEVIGVLQPIDDVLNFAIHSTATQPAAQAAGSSPGQANAPLHFTIEASTIDGWCSQIDDKVSYLGKQDQLGLITLGDMNSQINQTKQIASNLIDGINKASSAIIANFRV